MPILLNDNLDINAPRPTDNRFGPFANTNAALAGVPSAQRYIGLTVGVLDANNVVSEYWFDDGIANTDLILKTTDSIAAYNQANAAYGQANSAYAQANAARDQANTAYGQANAARDQANTAYSQANDAYAQANSAFSAANNRVLRAGDTMTGNLIMSGATINTATANISTIVTGNTLSLSTGIGSNSNVTISANGTELIRVTNTGLVGIGTTTPSSRLTVVDSGNWQVNITGTSPTAYSQVYFNGTGRAYGVGVGNASETGNDLANKFFVYDHSSGTRFVIDPSGNTGINITSPTSRLHVVGNANITLGINTTTINATTINAATLLTRDGINVSAQAADSYAQANAAYNQANNAYGQANAARDQANTAYGQANSAYAQANASYGQANSAYNQANSAYGQANSAYNQANSAYAAANTSGNTTSVSANTGSTQRNVGLNFSNTTTINVSVGAGTAGNANIEFTVNTAGSGITAAYNQANAAYGQANLAYNQANAAYSQANSAYDQANSAYGQANLAYAQANAAYTAANNSNLLSGGVISGTLNISNDLIVGGNIYLNGNTTYINVATYTVDDPLIYLAANNDLTDSVDIGFVGGKNTGGTYSHTGLARDATDAKWKLFDNLPDESHVNNVINFANSSIATLVANIEANSILLLGNSVATNVMVNAAYAQANAAYDQANAAANTVAVFANGTLVLTRSNINFNNSATVNISAAANGSSQTNLEFTVNTTSTGIVAAYTQANNAYAQANDAYAQANNAYGQANLAYSAANTSGNTTSVSANTGSTQRNVGLNFSNTSTVNVSVAAGTTGNANIEFVVNRTGSGIVAAHDQANSAYAQANAAANTVAVYANDAAVITNANVNFNNSATVNVSVTANSTTGRGNIEFTVNTTSTGIVAAYNQANSARDQANTAYDQANSGYSQANSAANTVAVFANGTLVLNKSNINFNNSATVNVSVTANGSSQSNLEFTVNTTSSGIVAAYDQANNAYGQANSAYSQANNAYAQANAAYTAANNAAVKVAANNGPTISSNTIVFNNTSTVSVVVDQNGTNANISFVAAPQTVVNDTYTAAGNVAAAATANIANGLYGLVTTVYDLSNTIYAQANSAANTVRVSQNGSGSLSAKQLNFVNTSTVFVSVTSGTSGNANIELSTPISSIFSDTFTANGAQSNFNLSGTSYSTNTLFVFVDGVSQVPGTDYTVSGNVVTFTSPPEANGIIEARSFQGVQIYQPANNIIFDPTELYAAASSLNFTTGGFSDKQDSISRTYLLRGTTTNGSETELFLLSSARIPVAANTTVFYTADIVARRTDVTGESAGYYIKGVVDNFSGTVADVGDLYEVVVAEDDLDYVVDARADDTNNSINFYVTGEAGKTIRWTALVRTIEVAQ